jgi:hypothetical protein
MYTKLLIKILSRIGTNNGHCDSGVNNGHCS